MLTEPGINSGGLFRCCTHLASERNEAIITGKQPWPDEGELLRCPHCANQMIFKEGSWCWDREAFTKEKEAKSGAR